MAATLASLGDVKAVLGRDLTSEEAARVDAILVKASALFRLHSGQEFTFGSSEVRRRVVAGQVYLPQRPVVEVNSVTDDDGRPVAYTRRQQTLTLKDCTLDFVIVKYEHGANKAPDLVRTTVAEIAKKVLTVNPNAAQGLTQRQEMVGPYSALEQYATWAQGGQTMLSPDDRAIAESFKVRPPRLIVMRP